MSERFYVPDLPLSGYAELPPEEAHHALEVMRMKPGEELILFDGCNREAVAILPLNDERLPQGGQKGQKKSKVKPGKNAGLTVEIRSCGIVNRESGCKLTIAVALPKGDRQKWLVEKCTELGVHQILPLDVERSVAKPQPQVVERLQRQVIEASKQCRRNFLMEITEPYGWSDFLEYSRTLINTQRWIAHPGGEPISALSQSSAAEILVAIGPEGGFSDSEVVAAMDAGFLSLSLGERILRIETAAVAVAALAIR